MENTDESQNSLEMTQASDPAEDEKPSYSQNARIGFFSSGIGLSAASLGLLLVFIILFMASHTSMDFPATLASLAGICMIISLLGLMIGGILCFKLHPVSYLLGILLCLVQLSQFLSAAQNEAGDMWVMIYRGFSLWTILLFIIPLSRLAAKTRTSLFSKLSSVALVIGLLLTLFNLIKANTDVKSDLSSILMWTAMISILFIVIASVLGAITYFKLFKLSDPLNDPEI